MKQFSFEKIREFRVAADLTQEGLAIAMSTPTDRVHKEQISEWERASSTNGGLTVKSLIKLADALQKTPDDFFTDDTEGAKCE